MLRLILIEKIIYLQLSLLLFEWIIELATYFMSNKTFRTLPLLPKVDEGYLKTIELMLYFLDDDIYRTRKEFVDWIVNKFECSQTSATNYIQVLGRIDLIERKRHNRLGLSRRGADYSNTGNPETRAMLIADVLIERYYGFVNFLTYLAQKEVSNFEQTLSDLISNYDLDLNSDILSKQIYWAISLGCIQQLGYRREYSLTIFGRVVINRDDTDTLDVPSQPSQEHYLKSKVRWAARFTEDPSQFEHIVASVFEYLGYDVVHSGVRGETDVFAAAFLGSEGYSFIVDTKARHDGKLYDLEVMTIQTHRHNSEADFAVIVAETFGGKKIKSHAQQNSILLMPIDILLNWIDIHDRSPLNLLEYKAIVQKSGHITKLPSIILERSAQKHKYNKLLSRIIEFLTHAQKINPGIRWTPRQIHSTLAMEHHSEMYTIKEVSDVLDFLANPIIDALRMQGNETTLCVDRSTFAQIINSIDTQTDPEM